MATLQAGLTAQLNKIITVTTIGGAVTGTLVDDGSAGDAIVIQATSVAGDPALAANLKKTLIPKIAITGIPTA